MAGVSTSFHPFSSPCPLKVDEVVPEIAVSITRTNQKTQASSKALQFLLTEKLPMEVTLENADLINQIIDYESIHVGQ